jgi:ketosteroid isomerase-like protein
VDFGDRVLVLVRSFGRLEGSTAEVRLSPANVLTVRDGRISRYDAYADRHEALKAVGLEE